MAKPDYDELKRKFLKDLRTNLSHKTEKKIKEKAGIKTIESSDYEQFLRQYMPKHLSLYEKLCQFSGKILKLKADKKKEKDLEEAISICHLDITPGSTLSFSVLLPALMILTTILLFTILPTVVFGQGDLFLAFLGFVVSFILIFPLQKLPFFFANNWRMKASNQMVLCVFYLVTYMRHTPNLELAIDFAAQHIAPPLSLDLKKVLWNIETEKYDTIKESLDNYLETWKKWNPEFIESVNLVESSLYETSEDRRLTILDKALSVILEETYEKMLHYAQNLKSPITMLHMLGIVLPILGLVILPLVVSFMEGVKWYYLFAIYNVIISASVFILGKSILSKRPTGYGAIDISELNPELKKLRKYVRFFGLQLPIGPMFIAVFVGLMLFFVGIFPIIVHVLKPSFDVTLFENFKFIGYRENSVGELVGPFGIGASIFSFFIPLSLAYGIGIYNRLKSKELIKIRTRTKELEKEFASGLFQLGNRLGDGIPAEIAFGKVATSLRGTRTGDFFAIVYENLTKRGMDVQTAIFDKQNGALKDFPSPLIESSMKVLIESSKKGPLIASQSLTSMATYIKEMHRVDERLKDMMEDTISGMKSQLSFLTPAIAGIVIGITSMITTILGTLSDQLSQISQGASDIQGAGLIDLFGLGIPTFFFQIIVGVYVVQITYILTMMVNGIENGYDTLNEEYLRGKNLTKSTILYSIIGLIVLIIFNAIAGHILAGIQVGQTTI